MRWISLLLTLLLTAATGLGRTFVSANGKRAIKATLLDYDEKAQTIKIRRHDGKVFTNALSAYSRADHAYVLRWNDALDQFGNFLEDGGLIEARREGPEMAATKEEMEKGRLTKKQEERFKANEIRATRGGIRANYAYYGREYPGHLQLFMKLLEAGNIGYGQTIIYGRTHPPIIIGNGGTPFLAFVNGYNLLAARRQQSNVTGVAFNLLQKNWQARLAFQSMRSTATGVGTPMVMGTNVGVIQSVGGPILYQHPNNVIIINHPPMGGPVIMLPRPATPVFVNPLGGGIRLNGVTMGTSGYVGGTNSFSRGGGINVRLSK